MCRDAVNDCDIPETCTGDSSQVGSTPVPSTLDPRWIVMNELFQIFDTNQRQCHCLQITLKVIGNRI